MNPPENIGLEKFQTYDAAFADLDRSFETMGGDNERLRKYTAIKTKASLILLQFQTRNVPGGTGDANKAADMLKQLQELYDEAALLRWQTVSSYLQKNDYRFDDLQDRLQNIFPEEKFRKDLLPIVEGFQIEPGSPGGKGFIKNGRLDVARTSKALDTLVAYQASALVSMNPEAMAYLQHLQQGIAMAAKADPQAAWQLETRRYVESVRGKTDWRPLRFVGGLLAATITAFGLVQGYRKGELDWPTGLWAAITLGTLRPDFFRSAGLQQLERFQILADPNAQRLLTATGFAGDKGAQALQEIQQVLASDTGKFRLRKLAPGHKRNQITNDELEQFFGSTSGPGYKLLSTAHPEVRWRILNLINGLNREPERLPLQEYIKSRAQPMAL